MFISMNERSMYTTILIWANPGFLYQGHLQLNEVKAQSVSIVGLFI